MGWPARHVPHQVGHVPLQREPGAVDLGGCLGNAHLRERILRRLLAGVGDPDPLAKVGHVRLVGAGRHADDRRGDPVGENRPVREPVQRRRVECLPRHDEPGDVDEAQRPVLGHEHVRDHDVVAAGAAQAHGVPDIVDRVLGARQQEGPEVDRPVVIVGDDLAEQDPGGVIAAGGEAPPAADLMAALDQPGPAGRCIGGRDPGRRVVCPRPPAAPAAGRARHATGARRGRSRPSRWSRRRSLSAAPRCRKSAGRPRGRRSWRAGAAGRNPSPPGT